MTRCLRVSDVSGPAVSETTTRLDRTKSDDGLLYGVKAIAKHLGLTPRQVSHLIQKGHLPSFRLGIIICSTQRGLAEHFSQLSRSTESE